MDHILIERHDGYQSIKMLWNGSIPGFQPETFDILTLALKAADATDEIRATVFLGTPRCFCLGTDAAIFNDQDGLSGLSQKAQRFFHQLIYSRKPLLAAVDGEAVGLGMTMLLHFDAIFATPESRFRAPFAEWGLVPEASASLLLPETVGYRRAFEILCLGGVLTAVEAKNAGLVSHVMAHDILEAEAYQAAQRLARLPAKSLHATRELLRDRRHQMRRRADTETATFQRLLKEETTQRRLKAMGRAARMAAASGR